MSKINEIFAFTKLINKTTESLFEDICEIFQSLTFYSESQKINKDVFIIYNNSMNLLSVSFDNYISLYNNIDIKWKPCETHGIIYDSFYLHTLDKLNFKMKNKINLKKMEKYKKVKMVKFENNDYCHYLETFGTNAYSIALIYGDKEYVFKRLDEHNTVCQAMEILNHNIDTLSDLNNDIQIELIKFKKLIKINDKILIDSEIQTLRDIDHLDNISISDYDSYSYSDLNEN